MSEKSHKCDGPIVYRGDYKIVINQKQNNPGIKLRAHGIVHTCKACGWHYALPDEGRYANDNTKERTEKAYANMDGPNV